MLYPEHDGNLYGNRSLELPGRGLYREFTVPTPNLKTRGRRRLVINQRGMAFFTACHYERVPGQYGEPSHQEKMEAVDEQWRNGFYVVTGLSPSQQEQLTSVMQRIHNSRLPICIT